MEYICAFSGGVLSRRAFAELCDRLRRLADVKELFSNGLILFLNIAPVMLLALLLWAATKRTWLAFLITSVPTMTLAIANYLKIKFLNDPLLFEDVVYTREAAMMSGKYVVGVDKRIIIAAVLVAMATAALFFFPRGKIKGWSRLGLASCAVACIFFVRPLYTDVDIMFIKLRITTL